MRPMSAWFALPVLCAACAGEAAPRPVLVVEEGLDRDRVRREIASFHGLDPAELIELDGFQGGGGQFLELPKEPIWFRVKRRSEWSRTMNLPRSRSDPAGAWMAQEYEKIASEAVEAPAALTYPERLESSRYTFGLETRAHVLWLQAGTVPQLHTVTTRGGAILAEGIELEELERRFPEFAGFERLGETDLIDER